MGEADDALKIIDKAADLLHKLAEPMAEEFGALFGDKVRVYRVKNLVATIQKTERILRDADLPANAVPPRLLLPIVENSSVEDNETLQEMWAGLLSTSSQQTDSVLPSFVETLKQLTPDEARHLQAVYIRVRAKGLRFPAKTLMDTRSFLRDSPGGMTTDSFERLGLLRREIEVELRKTGSLPKSAGHPEYNQKHSLVSI